MADGKQGAKGRKIKKDEPPSADSTLTGRYSL